MYETKKCEVGANELEKQMKEINEWQNNYSNPGHYIGTGRVSPGAKNMFKSLVSLLILGLITLIPSIYSLLANISLENLISLAMPLVIGSGALVGAILRFKR